jgi:hypothetical protein
MPDVVTLTMAERSEKLTKTRSKVAAKEEKEKA